MISPASNQKPEPVPVFSLFRAAVIQPDEEGYLLTHEQETENFLDRPASDDCECCGQGCPSCDDPHWIEDEI
jgi:hypothetical protein